MPKIVDRDARRREIVETYLTLVAREGMEAATTRRLAEELGVATGALWHYFANFDEVLALAFATVFERTGARIADHVGDHRGLGALVRMLEQILPLTKTTQDEALVVVNFWGRVTASRHQNVRRAFAERSWQDEFRIHLEQAVADAELVAHTPTAALADALLVLSLGHQVTFVLDAPLSEPTAQWTLVRSILDPWATDRGRALVAPDPLAD
ncbi:TetR/AcrR family transcriptional regulator [Microbacterium sp. RD1]|uniref:TetR/AcrR family transcriptional regulator n=1 Tax=Microbacterium sp. RD1 TaxID=3457313 RepID=UPI003FA55A2D